ncbi:hypothetical protein EV356DRAFT_531909 [Viridothelium virens]|uniref:Rhodopsin domain-containing protein n=1 Tax=Viridothelium virens TaxID=1048519 RepID=A0A6A6HBP5_VIRVR|nr:hypothetical protein EV356DRAFT_531909 [Viridothelium virens]
MAQNSQNFDRRVNPLGVGLFAGSLTLFVLAVTSVAGRLWSRKIKKQKLMWSDALILCAMGCSIGLMVIFGMLVKHGQGRHIESLIAEQGMEGFAKTSAEILKIEAPLSDLWVIAVTCVRISILELYITIFNHKKWFKLVCRGFMGLQLAGMAVEMALVHTYKPTAPQAVACYLTIHSLFLFLDLSIALLPTPLIWQLKMQTRAKLQISILFGLGACVCACSALRIAWVNKIRALDFTFATTWPWFFCLVEPFLGITLANLPLIQPLMRRLHEIMAQSQTWQKLKSSLTSRFRSETLSDHSFESNGFQRLRRDKSKPSSDEESGFELRQDFASTELEVASKGMDSKTSPVPNQIEVTRSWKVQEAPI